MEIEPVELLGEPMLEPAEREMGDRLRDLPNVVLRHDLVPEEVSPARFFSVMVNTVLDNSPINFHRGTRHRRDTPRPV